MKKFNYIILGICILFINMEVIKAASFSISTDKMNVTVGETITVKVDVLNVGVNDTNSSAAWEYCLNYDNNAFSLTSSNSELGDECVRTGSIMTKGESVLFKLKANKGGTYHISLKNYAIYNYMGEIINVSNVETVININKKEASKPIKPVLEKVAGNTIVIKKVNGYEYSLDGLHYQDSNIFNGLKKDSEYVIYQRIKETDDTYRSVKSEGLSVRTSNVMLGDLNGNGKIDLSDVLMVLKLYFGKIKMNNDYLKTGDINNNGKIDLADVITILKNHFKTV